MPYFVNGRSAFIITPKGSARQGGCADTASVKRIDRSRERNWSARRGRAEVWDVGDCRGQSARPQENLGRVSRGSSGICEIGLEIEV